jgi:hypothetical protein
MNAVIFVWMRWLFLGACVGVVGFLALRGSPYVGELPWIPRWLADWADAHGVLRNVPAFAALYYVVLLGLGWRKRVIALVLVCVFAACVEFGQLWVVNRSFTWADIGASWAGAGLAHGVAVGVVAVRRRVERTWKLKREAKT